MSPLSAAAQAQLDAGRPDLAWGEVARALEADSLRVREHARGLLADLAPLLPFAAWTDAHEALAQRLLIRDRPRPLSPGVARLPAVSGGHGRLITARVTLSSAPQDTLPEGHDALRPAFDAARAALNDPTLRFSARFEPSEGWEGGSAGLALALAAVSAARSEPDLSLVVATGEISASGAVMTVGQLAEKQRLCREAAPRATLLVPQDAAVKRPLGALPVGTLREALDALGHREDPDARLEEVRRLDRAGRWEEAAQRAEALLPDERYSADQLGELLIVCLAAANHSADDARQEALATRLSAVIDELDDGALAQALGHLAVRAIDALHPERAAEVLALTPPSQIKERHQVHLLGPAALLHTLRGEHDAALTLRERALRLAPQGERPRALGDLADALIRVGRGEEAARRAQEALALAEKTAQRQGYQARTAAFLRLHLARALAACGELNDALAAVAPLHQLHGLDPALRGRLLTAELRRDLAEAQALHRTYGPMGGLVRALTLRTLARLGDPAAAAELLALPVFSGLSVEEAARRLPY